MAPPPALTDPEDLVEEVLRRLPPDDPASLFRAAVVSKRWRRLVSGRGFRRRFREFHRSPPPLGFLCNRTGDGARLRFVPASSFRPRDADRRGLRAVHSGHGRVLLHRERWGREGLLVVVWDPTTDEQRELPVGPPCRYSPTQRQSWSAAVLCAAAGGGGGGGCDHLDCRHGPFLVVFVASPYNETFSCVYSSEPDVATLGFATSRGYRLYLWSREHGPDDGARWAQDKIIGLDTLLPIDAFSTGPQEAGFSENGAGSVIFLWTSVGFFSVNLKSRRSKKVGESHRFNSTVVPYVSFLIPALQAPPVAVEPSA